MNFKLYIFGESSGYKQYPDDSNSFKECFKYQQSNSSLYIQRKADLVYYVYSQKIDKEKNSFLGFCIVFNGVYIKNFKNAFAIFEKIYSDCILSGKLFRLGENGKIGYATDDFASQTKEYDRLVSVFNDELEKKNRALFAQLPKTYKMGQGSKVFSMSDSPELIADGISVYDSVSIPNNNNNEDLDYVGRMLQQLYSENKKLKTEYEILNKQKKQYKWIVFLSLLIAAGLVVIVFFNQTISTQEDIINRKDAELLSVINKKNEIMSVLDKISQATPVVISSMVLRTNDGSFGDIIYSDNTTYIYPKIEVYSLIDGQVDFYIKFFTPNGLSTSSFDDYSYMDEQIMSKLQTQTVYLSGWGGASKGFWRSGSYRIEIWVKDKCLYEKKFTIH